VTRKIAPQTIVRPLKLIGVPAPEKPVFAPLSKEELAHQKRSFDFSYYEQMLRKEF